MRDYHHIERYLNDLMGDIYPQPPDEGQLKYIQEVIENWISKLIGIKSILDVGCGQGSAIFCLAPYADRVAGVTLGLDLNVCQNLDLEVYKADISFLPFDDEEFDLIFARHILEHSPMPLLTLMEWRRVAKQWLLLIIPTFSAFGAAGRNHYYILLKEQWEALLNRAGWHVIWQEDTDEDFEHRFMCEKAS